MTEVLHDGDSNTEDINSEENSTTRSHMTHSHHIYNDSSSIDDDDSSYCAMEESACVDISISTLPGDPITSEKAPTVSSKEGDDNDENIYLGSK